jgi:energy-coupling factor transporter ATP-binding protein EcfA2
MDDVLLSAVFERLAQESLLPEAEDLLLAALDSDDALSGQLDADSAHRYARGSTSETEASAPVGAYLRSVKVAGFRGIGPTSTLKVAPGPGLTLVVGRNGSGKSSFAEALEVLLTGTLMRWAPPAPSVVREGWRSKHAVGDIEITAEFFIEGSGLATLCRSWRADAELDKSTAWLQRAGEKRGPLSALGWDTHLKEYRPFLSHTELEAFFGRPSELYDLLASVLGLDDLVSADKRLNVARKVREDALSEVKQRLDTLRARMQLLAGRDERAQDCLTAVAGNIPAKWDIAAAKAAAIGVTVVDDGALAVLRGLAQLTPPSAAEVTAAIADARSTAQGLRELAGTNAAQAHELAALLDVALEHHRLHGDGDCPVCGNSRALTDAWRAATEQNRDRLRGEAVAATDAFEKAGAAERRANALLSPLPTVLAANGHMLTVDVARAREAWLAWIAPTAAPPAAGGEESSGTSPESLVSLAQHLEDAFPALGSAVTAVATDAAAEVANRDDQWGPVAADIAAWCGDADKARSGSAAVSSLKLARKWLADAMDDLRDRRLAPLAEHSRAIWADLRQESNVDLGAFRLLGANTTRRLDLDVSVDGSPSAALGVMSQGEINALALSIFLPRATMPDSPFNFLVIDDPVQAMDPAKVDGLTRVLHKVAQRRQVIVFTHDNRLASAIKDLGIPATISEVTRQPKSKVTVRDCLDASSQAIKDARALSKDEGIPLAVAERVIPGLCRTAVEATFTSAYWRAALRKERSRAAIEESLEPHGKRVNLRGIAQLALFGNITDASVAGHIDRQWGSRYADTYQALNKAAHIGHVADFAGLIEDTQALIRKISEKLP